MPLAEFWHGCGHRRLSLSPATEFSEDSYRNLHLANESNFYESTSNRQMQ